MNFTLHYIIEDLQGMDFVVDFEFHRNLDGGDVFDGAWTIIKTIEWDGDVGIYMNGGDDELVKQWLAKGGEDQLYAAAAKHQI